MSRSVVQRNRSLRQIADARASARASRDNADLWAFRFQVMRGIAAQYRRRALALRKLAARRKDSEVRYRLLEADVSALTKFHADEYAKLCRKLARIPRWVRRLFGAL